MAAGAATLVQLIYGMRPAQARLCSDARPEPLLCRVPGPYLRQKEKTNPSSKGQACKITSASATLPEMPGTGRARVLQACKHCPLIENHAQHAGARRNVENLKGAHQRLWLLIACLLLVHLQRTAALDFQKLFSWGNRLGMQSSIYGLGVDVLQESIRIMAGHRHSCPALEERSAAGRHAQASLHVFVNLRSVALHMTSMLLQANSNTLHSLV